MASQSEIQRTQANDGQLLDRVLSGATTFVKQHKTISTGYLIGMMLLLFGTGFKVSDELRDKYDRTIDNIDYEAQHIAHNKLWEAKNNYDRSKGWFFSCDTTCQRYKMKYEIAQAKFDELKREEAAITSSAKSQVGITSEYGVQETRDLFWGTFAGGKDFAKRQSLWDLLFTGLRWGKDEELFSVIIRWLIQLLFNFTLGLIGALVVFWWKLYGVISSYAPDPFTALLYFLAAGISATACVATYLLVLYGAAAGSVVAVAKVIVDNKRIGNGQNRPRQNLRYGGQPGYGGQQPGFGGQRAHFD